MCVWVGSSCSVVERSRWRDWSFRRDELLDLHARLHEAVGDRSLDHLEPGRWTPHVTVARRLTPEEAGAAVRLLSADVDDLVGSAVALRRWDGEGKREWRIG
ncbi:MAG: hypothetical protein U5N21_04765 [Rhodococcus sp. (in: high G+C Gram-positive bacteria)]|nr:hypothetical protein [Rhodococcus sp. (in: high G+C Gram-positive bacteria)]